ncbi:MAG: SHOCT domain-containing protein [Thaumarchaeota archaeon]|nr:SHOCT domain-containing protein [Nitrososphaerota archaeon]
MNKEKKTSSSDDDDPLIILKKRFAKGEITKKQYENMKSVLE